VSVLIGMVTCSDCLRTWVVFNVYISTLEFLHNVGSVFCIWDLPWYVYIYMCNCMRVLMKYYLYLYLPLYIYPQRVFGRVNIV